MKLMLASGGSRKRYVLVESFEMVVWCWKHGLPSRN